VPSKRDGHCEIYLHGSRMDDVLKGGDIDLLVFSEQLVFLDKIMTLAVIKDIFRNQKIDLTIKLFPACHSGLFVMVLIKGR